MKLKQLALIASLLCIVGPALAQTPTVAPAPAAAKPVAKTEKIEVTGSSIRRVDGEGSLPIQVITRAEIEREGISTAEQLVMLLSTNGTGLDNLASNADVVSGAQRGNNGASSANLRGQGSAATLILLNGRRVAAHGLNGGAVDLNQIPLAIVERVEVLKDGASAIYGTDAIGGVINFILQKDFVGVRVQSFADLTENPGGNIFRTSISAGYGDLAKDRFNLLATLTYSDNQELRGDQRKFVNTFQPNRGLSVDTRGTPHATIFPIGVGPFTPLGTVLATAGTSPFLPGSTTVRASGGISVLNLPGGPGCSSIPSQAAYDALLWDDPTRRFACAWDTGKSAVLQQPVKNTNFVSRGVYAFDNHTISAEVTASKVETSKRFSEIQLIGNATTVNVGYPRNATSASVYDDIFNRLVATFPTLESRRGLPIGYRWRCMECGRRQIDTTTDTGRAFIGAEGALWGGWDYRAGASYAYSESESTLGNGYQYRFTTSPTGAARPLPAGATGLINAMNTGIINPFLLPGQTQSAAALDLLRSTSANGVVLFGGRFTVQQIDLSASGEVFTLPAGPVMAAVGADLRTEKYRFNGDARAAATRPEIIGAPFDDTNALAGVSRDIKAIYTELLVPVVKGIEVTAAVRRDDYTGFGASTNPKVTFKLTPNKAFLIRGSYNTGFRVPSFNQIFNGATVSDYLGQDLVDPRTCLTGRVDTTRPGCGVVQPRIVNGGKLDLGPETAKQYSVGFVFEPLQGYSVNVDWWSIERSDTIQILSIRQLVDNFGLFGDRFLRDASGTLVGIDQRWVNAGGSLTKGLEVGIRGKGRAYGGSWSAGIDGTYLLEKKSRLLQNVPYSASEIGVFSFAGDLGIRWKHNAFATYRQGPWSVSASQIYRTGYQNQELPGVTSGRVLPPDLVKKVDDYTIYNLSATYSGIKNVGLTVGVKNLFNTAPPFAITYDSSGGSGSSWEPRVADPRMRSFTINASYKF